MKKNLLMFFLLLSFAMLASAQNRTEYLLEKNWKFSRTDAPEQTKVDFDDSQWQAVTVPHDWAIYGPFSALHDKQNVAILQDGQTKPEEHAGRTGGLPFIGAGWYRNTGNLPVYEKGKRVSIVFDGAMANSQVFINGKKQADGHMATTLFILI